jgi:hypothetical protein
MDRKIHGLPLLDVECGASLATIIIHKKDEKMTFP